MCLNFSVYHQVYNNKPKTESSLISLRNQFPNVHVRLLCDGGIDYSDIATQFQGVFAKFYSSNDLRTCKSCSYKMEPPPVIF